MMPGVCCGIRAFKRFNENWKLGAYDLPVYIHPFILTFHTLETRMHGWSLSHVVLLTLYLVDGCMYE
jgi:hypothetical protein